MIAQLSKLDEIQAEAAAAVEQITDAEQGLEAWRVKYLGRSSDLTQVLRGLADLPEEERPALGRRGNEVRQFLEGLLREKSEQLRQAELDRSLSRERLDVTLPGRPVRTGKIHPTTLTLQRICDFWRDLGFQVFESRDVETDEYNFELLNIPKHHPSREMWDTFYTSDENVILRTHTSPGQIHAMREFAPEPCRVILPGMCYRYEQISARSEIQFNQVEGLAIGESITFSNLKGDLGLFARHLSGEDTRTRFRASHFPFTEPSAEMDIECFVCGGEGCAVCKETGWLEILGCGMVHPKVLENGGYDPAVFTGYAYGMGPERVAMLLHGITDIRNFWRNDFRFLEQF